MAGNMSRNKGRIFEKLIRTFFEERQAGDPRRWQVTHRSRSREPGPDIVVWHGNKLELVIECKNDRTLAMSAMWRQAWEQAHSRGGGHAVVIHKRHGETRADDQWVTMTLDAFCALLEDVGEDR